MRQISFSVSKTDHLLHSDLFFSFEFIGMRLQCERRYLFISGIKHLKQRLVAKKTFLASCSAMLVFPMREITAVSFNYYVCCLVMMLVIPT